MMMKTTASIQQAFFEGRHNCWKLATTAPHEQLFPKIKKILKFDICLEGQEKPVGRIILNIICRMHLVPSHRGEFREYMDAHSHVSFLDHCMHYAY